VIYGPFKHLISPAETFASASRRINLKPKQKLRLGGILVVLFFQLAYAPLFEPLYLITENQQKLKTI